MWLIKLPFRILAFPLYMVFCFLVFALLLVGKCSSAILSLLLAFFVVCIIYYLWKGDWTIAAVMTGCGTLFMTAVFAIELISKLAIWLQERIGSFLFS